MIRIIIELTILCLAMRFSYWLGYFNRISEEKIKAADNDPTGMTKLTVVERYKRKLKNE